MNFDFKTVALGSLAALSLVAAPFVWTRIANANDGNDGRGGHRFEQLDLTEAQSSQIEAIRTETRSQMEAVLTPEQRETLADSDSLKAGLRALDLTDEQRDQIRSLKEDSREQIGAVLTDEQRQQLSEMRGRHGRGGRGRLLESLDLTEAQTAQIETIRSDARAQMAAVLTPEQRAELGDGEMGRRAWRTLDLTEEQREQLKAIHEETHEQIDAILTDEQRQQLPQRGRGDRSNRT